MIGAKNKVETMQTNTCVVPQVEHQLLGLLKVVRKDRKATARHLPPYSVQAFANLPRKARVFNAGLLGNL